ncbi:MAG TPA: alkaline phosphatase D family protein [Solirubrobacteraceae bacterium]|nr:alkaline phosphatase D family protein [Solirubrobacteraceae bacterium]
MPGLVLGPLHRWASTSEATVWVEADAKCDVEVRAGTSSASEPTFEVEGHHYAIVRIGGLPEEAATPYTVALDGDVVWPQPDSSFPPSALRTHSADGPARIFFGSCRTAYPHEPPYTLTPDDHDCGREVDALRAVALRMAGSDPADWPHTVILLGDQVYADEVSPDTLEFIRSRRDTSEPPGESIADFEEYTRLYREAWTDPPIRWLLSTVPTAMIFDDHDVIDDWNTSAEWVAEMRATDWWDRRIVGAFMAYAVYQHWGNLNPDALEEDPVFQRVRDAGDGGDILAEAAFKWDREVSGVRWSYCRDIGRSRIVMIDSRAGRVLDPGGRSMVDAEEWRWIVEHATGGYDHLLIGTSLPLIMAPALHYLEAWNEAICDGAWGGLAARAGEKLRQGADLEHWPAFRDSFFAMCELLREVGAGGSGHAPASIVVLSGDVHHAYLAEVAFPRGSGMSSHVWQATCSPFRNPLSTKERFGVNFGFTRAGRVIGRLLARAAGVPAPPVRWRFQPGDPRFDNQVGTLELDGRNALARLERAVPSGRGHEHPALEVADEYSLT